MFRKLEITLTALTVVATILLLGLAVAQPVEREQASGEPVPFETSLSETTEAPAGRIDGFRPQASLTMPYFSFAPLLPRQGGR